MACTPVNGGMTMAYLWDSVRPLERVIESFVTAVVDTLAIASMPSMRK